MSPEHFVKRRRAERRPVEWIGKYRIEGPSQGRWEPCRILDVSMTGAALEVFGTVPDMKDLITIDLQPTDAEQSGVQLICELRVPAEIRHTTEPKADEPGTRLGVEFVQMGTLAREVLRDLLERQHA